MTFTRESLVSKLTTSDQMVTFTKLDGSSRTMRCTLRESVLPQKTSTKTKAENLTTLSVWDLEKANWRSFKIANVTSVVAA